MGDLTSAAAVIKLDNVTRLYRREVGPVYRAVLTFRSLFELLARRFVLYAPKQQRGYQRTLANKYGGDIPESLYAELLPIYSEEIQVDPRRAQVMAVKYLQGRLYSVHITWNARKIPGLPEPTYDEGRHTLLIETVITIPDTGHRHRAYYELVRWKDYPSEVPAQLSVDGRPVYREEILELLRGFDPGAEGVYVDVYVLDQAREGLLYDEFNADPVKPSTAVALDLNPHKTPSRSFVYRLIERSPIFAREEIELRQNTIGSRSRKLTTNATLEAAVRPMSERLAELERKPELYDDLLVFTDAFFEEWAEYFPAWRPGASAEERHAFRDESFALSNIMMHPLFQLVFRLWEEYEEEGTDWRDDPHWREVNERIASVMDRDNPEWRGKILVEGQDKDGNISWSLSSTRQTRESAYRYLCQVAGVDRVPVARGAAD